MSNARQSEGRARGGKCENGWRDSQARSREQKEIEQREIGESGKEGGNIDNTKGVHMSEENHGSTKWWSSAKFFFEQGDYIRSCSLHAKVLCVALEKSGEEVLM